MNINQLIAERNRIEALIDTYELEQVNKNTPILIEEVMNFMDGVGEGFTPGDYYAEERYYSSIDGVKNFTLRDDNVILVKIVCPVYLPNYITIDNEKYYVESFKSSKYSRQVVDFGEETSY